MSYDAGILFNRITGKTVLSIANKVNYEWIATGQRPYLVTFEWTLLKDSTYVIHWSFEQNVKWYPWEKFQTLLNEKVLGAKMEEELQHLTACILSDHTALK